ncbi:carbon-nitrogen hydrolase family protein [Peribacillus glennii]|uniref:Carbon-nitrogen hydrolase family protein n=1 Tax=Peribacillus glennii TaxID=2303991 RepID=A0A372L6Q1_9BACI|nr:carbon-nitrogen hydrolase family protein [Peribacillus glennii]RFU60448.1 carbon-nitrogen hydrolase family protein [Peribacillus glennii]
MKLKVVGIQSGPYSNKVDYLTRIGQLAAQFDRALEKVPNADLIVFPELMAIPYFCKISDPGFFDFAEPLNGETFQFFSQKAKVAGVYVIITIFEKENDSTYYNTAIIISDSGEMVGYYRKTHIPKLSLPTLTTDESIYFARGSNYPIFDVKGFKVGILISFDRSFPEAARALALQGAELIVMPTAAGGEERKNAWLSECQARARENGVYVMGVNKAGEEILKHKDQVVTSRFFGLSCVFDPGGTAVEPSLDSTPWNFISCEIEREIIKECRSRLNFLDFLQGDLYFAYSDELQKIREFKIEKETEPLFGPKGVAIID